MAVIANLTGNTADGENFTNIAHSYIDQWQTLGIAMDATPPHTTLGYGLNDTHGRYKLKLWSRYANRYPFLSLGLLYNLYGDAELKLGLVPQSVYDMQSAFYPTVELEYGVPLDTRHNLTKGKLFPYTKNERWRKSHRSTLLFFVSVPDQALTAMMF